MPDLPTPALVVALPGTGSDGLFVTRAFGAACAARDLPLLAVEPDPYRVVDSYRAALDEAARRGPVIIAGISLGAAVAVEWAAQHPAAVTGVVAALPAWTGADTTGCPAALSASASAAQLRADGLAAVLERMRASTPGWLADALTHSWTAQWPGLPNGLDEAAAYRWPTPELLATVTTPTAVVTAVDDPVHPLWVAQEWANRIPGATLARTSLDDIGADPGVLGELGMSGLLPLPTGSR
ncbi:alpha/beta fold hydrolase [Nocardia stercoris]|uniref:Alpha/beta fold hydrolase n=1 Tax=Nocardia stercoris TaxID=2483361 RepID=A0A3M2KZK2_9NOCA|nr:alpha/beta hydrolase [Nocardia stercoris]RMI30076.1 alpha/beta fold hydrolase [Nocardia stercoris]